MLNLNLGINDFRFVQLKDKKTFTKQPPRSKAFTKKVQLLFQIKEERTNWAFWKQLRYKT